MNRMLPALSNQYLQIVIFLIFYVNNQVLAQKQTKPSYQDSALWAAHPARADWADHVPKQSTYIDRQATAAADVFYIHPTTYLYLFGVRNAKLSRKRVNHRTDFVVMNQASAFNGSCRVFAPRYRQVSLITFLKKSKNAQREAAFELAYSDVKAAFVHYLANENQGRPIVIAGHSQGSYLGLRLLEEFFDGQPLQDRLVAAYLIGNASATPLDKFSRDFATLRPAQRADDTGVVVGWNSYGAKGKRYPFYVNNDLTKIDGQFTRNKGRDLAAINPLNWKTDSTFADPSRNLGGTRFVRNPKRFEKTLPALCDAQLQAGVLRIGQVKAGGFKIPFSADSHIVDYNLFYGNIRHNVAVRVAAWLQQHPAKPAPQPQVWLKR